MPHGLFRIAHLRQSGISDHQIPGNHCHLHNGFPVLIHFLPALFDPVHVTSFPAFLLYPCEGMPELLRIKDIQVQAPAKLGHVDLLHPHSQIIFKEVMIDHGTGDPHGGAAHCKIGLVS